MTRIWVPRCKIIEPRDPIAIRWGMGGRFKLTTRRPGGRIRAESPWFDNLILDQGLNRLGTSATALSACAVGTGTTAPDVAQTTLITQLAVTTTIQSTQRSTASEPPYRIRKVNVYRFAEGVAAGNLTEVGVGYETATPRALFARELIRDSEGNPIAFTVLSDETLDVTYDLSLYPVTTDFVDDILIGGDLYEMTVRPAEIATGATGASNGWAFGSAGPDLFIGGAAGGTIAAVTSQHSAHTGPIGAITGVPTGAANNCSSVTLEDYTPGNFYREYSAQWGLAAGNVMGGIGAVRTRAGQGTGNVTHPRMNYQAGYDPLIPKTSDDILTLPFRHSWGRL